MKKLLIITLLLTVFVACKQENPMKKQTNPPDRSAESIDTHKYGVLTPTQAAELNTEEGVQFAEDEYFWAVQDSFDRWMISPYEHDNIDVSKIGQDGYLTQSMKDYIDSLTLMPWVPKTPPPHN